MRIRRNLARSEDGAGAVEFALVAPALFGFIIGLTQLGMLFFANADLHNAVAAGARLAMIWPRPTDDQIKQRIVSMLPKLDQSKLSAATVTHGTDAAGHDYADLAINYQVPLNFIFYKPPAITLRENRRVYIQDDTPIAPTTNPTTTSASTTSTSTTSSGTTSATSATSASTSTTSSTSATSSGTTTSSSSWGTTSTTSTTSSTTSGNNASSGNASSGNPHAHGNCNGNNC
ncbi:MAG: TadE/TadG family type IV pilus assembly protein [Allosphingosinicella sp.]